jgi:hypothetical protein
MIELALGAAVAALIAKALDRAGEKAVDQGEGAVRRLVELVRGRLSETDDEEGTKALERVEDAPDSPSRVEALARLLGERAKDNPELRRELAALVEEAEGSGIDVGGIVQATYGDQSPQLGVVSNSEVKISYGDKGGEGRVRRISE